MSLIPSADARAVVAAVDRLTTQVRRLADGASTPVTVADDAPTTTADDARRLPPMDPVHILGIDPSTPEGVAPQQAPAADEEQERTARRERLHNLLARADRGTLTPGETAALRDLVDAEARDADTARAVAAGNKRHVQLMYEEVQAAEVRARKAERAADLLADSHRRAEEARAELEQAQAAIDRVRALADQWDNALAPARSQYSEPVRAALDDTEQPTTKD